MSERNDKDMSVKNDGEVSTQSRTGFTDIEGKWYQEYVEKLYDAYPDIYKTMQRFVPFFNGHDRMSKQDTIYMLCEILGLNK